MTALPTKSCRSGWWLAIQGFDAESTRISTYTWGTVSDSGSGASGINEVWVGISSGGAQNVWWNEAARDFKLTTPELKIENLPAAQKVNCNCPNCRVRTDAEWN